MTSLFIRGWRVLLFLLLLGPAARAQFSPAEVAQYQRRLRAIRFDHRFWDAPPDSLRRVLATQRVDSQRLQTLEHLQYVAPQTTPAEDREALALATRLHYAERAPLRLLLAAHRLAQAQARQLPALLDTLQAALRLYEALGPAPQLALLEDIRQAYDGLNQQAAKRAFFQHRLAVYQARGPAEGVALCYRNLGSYYGFRGSFNQCLSYRLRAAELFRTFSNARYYHEIGVIGSAYSEWGNNARGLAYLHQALAWPGNSSSD